MPVDTLPELGKLSAPSAQALRAPGAALADKAAVGLLLLALSTLWLFERSSYVYRLEEGGYRSAMTAQSLTLAANLAPEHRFLMFFRQTGETAENRTYVPYNRFPIGTYLVLKGALLPFGHHLAAQIRAAQTVTLLFFAGAVVLAYLALRRLRHGPWVALAATLLAFASFYSLHYADMVSTEITSLFGLWLTAYGLIRFAHDGRLRPLLAKTGLALLLGWHVMGLLLPFVVLGLAQETLRAWAAAPQTRGRALLAAWTGSPYLKLGLAAALFCAALLAFNLTNEYFALEGNVPWAQLPTVDSLNRRSLGPEVIRQLQWGGGYLYAFLPEQLRRIGTLVAPYALVRGLGYDLGYEHDTFPTFFMAAGLVVCSLCLLGLRDSRPRRARAALLLSGWVWVLAVPGSAHWHDFEALFHLGLPLFFFAQLLQGLRRRVPRTAVLPVAAVAALAVFGLSARLISRGLPVPLHVPDYRALLADFTTIRPFTVGRNVCVPEQLQYWVGGRLGSGVNLLTYYLAGSLLNYSPEHCENSPSAFTIAPVRVEGDALLTPANRVMFLYAVDALEATPYRAALRAVQASAPFARAEFDVYAHAQTLIYHRPTACRPADAQTRFVFHVEPVHVNDLPTHRRAYGFDSLNFNFAERGVRLDPHCLAVAPLPAYPVARIRTGQFIRAGPQLWEATFPFRPSYEAALRAVQAAVPLVRAEFDVYAGERTLIYRKTACRPADAQARFFLHVVPVNVKDLPRSRRPHNFANLDFDFARRGIRLDNQCLAIASLPAYPIAHIRTGQFTRAGGALWTVELPPSP